MHHKISVVDLVKLDMTTHPASGHLAEQWHAFVDDEAVTHVTDLTQLQMLRQWRLLLQQGLPWNAPRVPQACLMHMSACSVASAI